MQTEVLESGTLRMADACRCQLAVPPVCEENVMYVLQIVNITKTTKL